MMMNFIACYNVIMFFATLTEFWLIMSLNEAYSTIVTHWF